MLITTCIFDQGSCGLLDPLQTAKLFLARRGSRGLGYAPQRPLFFLATDRKKSQAATQSYGVLLEVKLKCYFSVINTISLIGPWFHLHFTTRFWGTPLLYPLSIRGCYILDDGLPPPPFADGVQEGIFHVHPKRDKRMTLWGAYKSAGRGNVEYDLLPEGVDERRSKSCSRRQPRTNQPPPALQGFWLRVMVFLLADPMVTLPRQNFFRW